MTADGFSAAVVTKEKVVMALSEDAIAGLCWLRGDNFPGQITASGGEAFHVTSARTQLSAEEKQDRIRVTAAVTLHGSGDSDAAAEEIERVCRAAFQETVSEHHADVIDMELVCGVNAMISWRNRTGILPQICWILKYLSSESPAYHTKRTFPVCRKRPSLCNHAIIFYARKYSLTLQPS